jgi:hypothetical protein
MYRLPFLRLIRPRGYSPVGPGGVEPPIASLSGKCLNRLGHRPVAEAGVFGTHPAPAGPSAFKAAAGTCQLQLPLPARHRLLFRGGRATHRAGAENGGLDPQPPSRGPAAFETAPRAREVHLPGGPACAGWLRPRTGRRRTENTIPIPRWRDQPLSRRCPAPARFILHEPACPDVTHVDRLAAERARFELARDAMPNVISSDAP